MKLILDTFASVTVTPNTTWVFAVLSDGEGNSTTVEIGSRQVAEALSGMVSVLDDEDVTDESEVEALLGLTPDDAEKELDVSYSSQRAEDCRSAAMRHAIGSQLIRVPRGQTNRQDPTLREHQPVAVRHRPDSC